MLSNLKTVHAYLLIPKSALIFVVPLFILDDHDLVVFNLMNSTKDLCCILVILPVRFARCLCLPI